MLNPIRKLRTSGLLGTVGKIKEKYLLREKYIYICSRQVSPACNQYRLIPADRESLSRMYNQHSDELTPDKYQVLLQRMESSTEDCLLMADQEQVCGYCHSAYADHFNVWSNLRVKVEPGQVYLFDDYVFRNHRGKGLHKFSIARRMELARDRGCSRFLTIIDKSNIASHRAYTSQGFQRTQLIWHLPLIRKNIFRTM